MQTPSPARVLLSWVQPRDVAGSASLASAAYRSVDATQNGAAHTTASPAIPALLRSTIRCESCDAALLQATAESLLPLSSQYCRRRYLSHPFLYARNRGGLLASQLRLSCPCRGFRRWCRTAHRHRTSCSLR